MTERSYSVGSSSTSTLLVRVPLFATWFMILEISPELLSADPPLLASIAWNLLAGALIAVIIGWIFRKTSLRRVDIILVAWPVLFIIYQFSVMLEGYAYTSVFSSNQMFATASLFSLMKTLGLAVIAGALFTPKTSAKSLVSELRGYLKSRRSQSWVWRIALSSVVYLPIFFVFGGLIWPFVSPYYSDPSTGLQTPPATVVFPLEVFRGFLYVVALLPILAIVKGGTTTLYLMVFSLLYVPGSLLPLVTGTFASQLPTNIFLFHLFETLGDSLVFGAVVVHVLRRGSG